MKAKIYFWAMAFVALLMVGCSDDESGIQFTQDEIVQGDILTGKQVGVKNNSLIIYTTEGGSVNVQGAKGKISAKSSDENVVTVSCEQEAGQYGEYKQIILHSVAIGKAIVTVTDEDGNEAKLAVEVKDVETLWETCGVYGIHNPQCHVEGVSKEDSLAIASDAIASKPYQCFKMKRRGFNDGLFTSYRIQFLDASNHVIVDGCYYFEDNEESSIRHYTVRNRDGEILENFFWKMNYPVYYWDLTDKYKEAYPQVTKVELVMQLEHMS